MVSSRALRIVVGVVVGLVLATTTLYLGAYFALASTPGRTALKAAVMAELERAGVRASVADVRWGPAPGALWATGIALDLPLATVSDGLLEATIALPELTPSRVALHVHKVAVRLPEAGEPPVVAAPSGAPRPSKKRVVIPDVRVAVDELDLTGPGFAANVRDLALTLVVDDTITATLATGPCHVAWQHGRRVLGFDHCDVAGRFAQSDKRVSLDDVRLTRGDTTVVRAHGTWLGGVAHAAADLDLAAWEAAALAGDALPGGLVVQGLELDLEASVLSGSIAALHAPRYVLAPFEGELVELTIDHFRGEPGLLIPQVDVSASNLDAARASGFDWVVDNVHAPSLSFALAKKLEGTMPAFRADRWTTPAGSVGPIEADVEVAIGLSGGSVTGQLAMPEGTLDARGQLKTSPLTKRSTFTATAAFEGLRGPLATLVRHDGDAALKDALGEPLAGSLQVAIEAQRESRHDAFELELEWDTTELSGKVKRSWDGSDWVEPSPAVPDEAPEP